MFRLILITALLHLATAHSQENTSGNKTDLKTSASSFYTHIGNDLFGHGSNYGMGMISTANSRDLMLSKKREITRRILEIKRGRNLTWSEIANAVGRSPVWVTACILGEASMDEPAAQKLVEFLGTQHETGNYSMKKILMEFPIKGQISSDVLLQDPCIYRLHEVALVYGSTVKELIQEKFGDGIMSAIDFQMEVEKEEDIIHGDRVRIVMSGKFLPYKRW